MKKLVIGIILAVVAVGGYLAWQNTHTEQFSGWQSYANAQYGFSLKYPPTYGMETTIITGTSPERVFVGEFNIHGPEGSSDALAVPDFRLSISTDPLQDIELVRSQFKAEPGDTITSAQNITFQGERATEITYETSKINVKTIDISHHGYTYRIYISPKDNALLDQVLSTLKFTR